MNSSEESNGKRELNNNQQNIEHSVARQIEHNDDEDSYSNIAHLFILSTDLERRRTEEAAAFAAPSDEEQQQKIEERIGQVIENYLQDTLDQFTADLGIDPRILQTYTERDEEELEEKGYSSEDGIRRLRLTRRIGVDKVHTTYWEDRAIEIEQQPSPFTQKQGHINNKDNKRETDYNQRSAKGSPTEAEIEGAIDRATQRLNRLGIEVIIEKN